MRCNVEFYYVRENPTYRYRAAASCGVKMVLFTASRGNNFVGGTCAPRSAVLVLVDLFACRYKWFAHYNLWLIY